MKKKVTVKRGGREYKYLYTDNPLHAGTTTKDGYKVVYKADRYVAKRSGKSLALIGKSGKVYQSRIDELLAATPDRTTANEIRAKIYNWQRHHKGDKLTIRGLTSVLEESRYAKMFINAGYTVDEVAKQLGTTREELLNKRNWDGSRLTIGGTSYDFIFSYTRNVMREVKAKK